MGKGKPPRKRKDLSTQAGESEQDVERQTQEKAELVPPSRRPPTAVGAETPPLPPREPPGPSPRPLPERQRPRRLREPARSALVDIIAAIRLAAGALLNLADAAADAVRGQIEGQA